MQRTLLSPLVGLQSNGSHLRQQRFTGIDFGSPNVASSLLSPQALPLHSHSNRATATWSPEMEFDLGLSNSNILGLSGIDQLPNSDSPGFSSSSSGVSSHQPIAYSQLMYHNQTLQRQIIDLEKENHGLRAETRTLKNTYNTLAAAVPQLLSGHPGGLSMTSSTGNAPMYCLAPRAHTPPQDWPTKDQLTEDELKALFWDEGMAPQKTGRTGTGKRGRPSAGEKEGKLLPFVVDRAGIPVSSDRLAEMRRIVREFCIQLAACGMAPNKWLAKPMNISDQFHFEMGSRFPELQLCSLGWKADRIASGMYSQWRSWQMKKLGDKFNVPLTADEKARVIAKMEDDGDFEDDDEDDDDVAPKKKAKGPDDLTTTRPAPTPRPRTTAMPGPLTAPALALAPSMATPPAPGSSMAAVLTRQPSMTVTPTATPTYTHAGAAEVGAIAKPHPCFAFKLKDPLASIAAPPTRLPSNVPAQGPGPLPLLSAASTASQSPIVEPSTPELPPPPSLTSSVLANGDVSTTTATASVTCAPTAAADAIATATDPVLTASAVTPMSTAIASTTAATAVASTSTTAVASTSTTAVASTSTATAVSAAVSASVATSDLATASPVTSISMPIIAPGTATAPVATSTGSFVAAAGALLGSAASETGLDNLRIAPQSTGTKGKSSKQNVKGGKKTVIAGDKITSRNLCAKLWVSKHSDGDRDAWEAYWTAVKADDAKKKEFDRRATKIVKTHGTNLWASLPSDFVLEDVGTSA
ncbi:hypothetical protein NEOLEDRAFT_1180335 [Neolentinus lepideus HHB14362 ss-1]|uniref:Uncharacterized protein n=1 Tax=Neolentinus lepideus HHB14362 ss-1 TaxID=1314782 RepID=A0A165QZJ5_9AGAM|nr:hypothetical protein NEOLEDRAFT_1180335 [Neolentinus lepideus HHB14362 ss-1]